MVDGKRRLSVNRSLDRFLEWKGLTTSTAVVLLFFFLALALVILPSHPLVETQSFELSIANETGLQTLLLTMDETSKDHYQLEAAVLPTNSQLKLILHFQHGVTPNCQQVNEPGSTCHLGASSFGSTLSLTFSGSGLGRVMVPINASAFTFASNGLNAYAWLPVVSCVPDPPSISPNCANFASVHFSIRYAIPDFISYTWNGALLPTPELDPVVLGAWNRTSAQMTTPFLATGISSDGQDADNFRLAGFGAVAGVAAAMFALSVQSGIEWIAKSRKVKADRDVPQGVDDDT
jgi:hypothetical protein